MKINDITIDVFNEQDNTFIVRSPHGIITLDGDVLRDYIVKGFSDNLKNLLKLK